LLVFSEGRLVQPIDVVCYLPARHNPYLMIGDSIAERRLHEIHELRLSLKQRIAESLPGAKVNTEFRRLFNALELDAVDAELKREAELRRRFNKIDY